MPGILEKIGGKLPCVRRLHRQVEALEAERASLQSALGRAGAEKEEAEARHATALEAVRKEAAGRVEELEAELKRRWTWVLPGDPRSPLPDLAEMREREAELFVKSPVELPGIELWLEEQATLLREMKKYAAELPFPEQRTSGKRFSLDAPEYGFGDAFVLYGLMRKLRPRKVVVVGGPVLASAVLDANEASFGRSITVTLVGREPDALRALLKKEEEKVKVFPDRFAALPQELLPGLTAGDLLVVDSSHVVKTGNDVTSLVLKTFPRLRSGVHVHVNGVFWPFDYPASWVLEGRAFNEAYLVRAFLTFSSAFETVFFASFLEQHHRALLEKEVPRWTRSRGGGLWFKRK